VLLLGVWRRVMFMVRQTLTGVEGFGKLIFVLCYYLYDFVMLELFFCGGVYTCSL
jgi:hypothetical protein